LIPIETIELFARPQEQSNNTVLIMTRQTSLLFGYTNRYRAVCQTNHRYVVLRILSWTKPRLLLGLSLSTIYLCFTQWPSFWCRLSGLLEEKST